jgi:hypothetical protein
MTKEQIKEHKKKLIEFLNNITRANVVISVDNTKHLIKISCSNKETKLIVGKQLKGDDKNYLAKIYAPGKTFFYLADSSTPQDIEYLNKRHKDQSLSGLDEKNFFYSKFFKPHGIYKNRNKQNKK